MAGKEKARFECNATLLGALFGSALGIDAPRSVAESLEAPLSEVESRAQFQRIPVIGEIITVGMLECSILQV